MLERFQVKYFVTVPVSHTIQEYHRLWGLVKSKQIETRYLEAGEQVRFSDVTLTTLWPDRQWLIDTLGSNSGIQNVLAVNSPEASLTTSLDLNLFSIYLHLQYGGFDLLLTGDGDQHVQDQIDQLGLLSFFPQNIEVLKVPHHGSKTSLREKFLSHLRPRVAVIQVGKNSYGHPHGDLLRMLDPYTKTLRTDLSGDIEVVSDSSKWIVSE